MNLVKCDFLTILAWNMSLTTKFENIIYNYAHFDHKLGSFFNHYTLILICNFQLLNKVEKQNTKNNRKKR